MTVILNITPRQFGNIAAQAITQGLDVTRYLIKTTLDQPAPAAPVAEPPAATAAEQPQELNLTC